MKNIALLTLLSFTSCKREAYCYCYQANGTPYPDNHVREGTKHQAKVFCRKLQESARQSGGHCILSFTDPE